MDFLDIFCAQNDCLVMGYLMGKEMFWFWPYLCLWWLFKQGNRKGRFWYLLRGGFEGFYFGMLPTQCSHQPLLYPLTAALYHVLGHHPLLVIVWQFMPFDSLLQFLTASRSEQLTRTSQCFFTIKPHPRGGGGRVMSLGTKIESGENVKN